MHKTTEEDHVCSHIERSRRWRREESSNEWKEEGDAHSAGNSCIFHTFHPDRFDVVVYVEIAPRNVATAASAFLQSV